MYCIVRYWNWVIAKIEHTGKGSNPRYVVTNLKGNGKTLYDKLYCARGEMENRIKEQQLDLFADRTSCHRRFRNMACVRRFRAQSQTAR